MAADELIVLVTAVSLLLADDGRIGLTHGQIVLPHWGVVVGPALHRRAHQAARVDHMTSASKSPINHVTGHHWVRLELRAIISRTWYHIVLARLQSADGRIPAVMTQG